jgi:hypothetical protein
VDALMHFLGSCPDASSHPTIWAVGLAVFLVCWEFLLLMWCALRYVTALVFFRIVEWIIQAVLTIADLARALTSR